MLCNSTVSFGDAVFALILCFSFMFFLLILVKINLGSKKTQGNLEVIRCGTNMCTYKYSFKICFYFICNCILPVCYVCTCSVSGGQKRTSNPLEIELQRVVSCHMVLGTEPWSSTKSRVPNF